VPRIRSIKPEMWDDEAIGDVSREARLLFIGLISQADDDGRLPASPRWLISKLYPYDDLTAGEVENWLAELDRAGLILSYAHAGRPYAAIRTWDRHQSIDKRYHRPSKLPGPDDEGTTRTRRGHDESSTPDVLGIGVDSSASPSSQRSFPAEPSSLPENVKATRSEIQTGGRLWNLLADLIAENDPDKKRPTVTKRWLDAERLLVTRDGRNPEQIERVIRWCQADGFEHTVILSMPKFRERYRALVTKAARSSKSGVSFAELDALGERFRREEATA
jgi:hypothetical protein